MIDFNNRVFYWENELNYIKKCELSKSLMNNNTNNIFHQNIFDKTEKNVYESDCFSIYNLLKLKEVIKNTEDTIDTSSFSLQDKYESSLSSPSSLIKEVSLPIPEIHLDGDKIKKKNIIKIIFPKPKLNTTHSTINNGSEKMNIDEHVKEENLSEVNRLISLENSNMSNQSSDSETTLNNDDTFNSYSHDIVKKPITEETIENFINFVTHVESSLDIINSNNNNIQKKPTDVLNTTTLDKNTKSVTIESSNLALKKENILTVQEDIPTLTIEENPIQVKISKKKNAKILKIIKDAKNLFPSGYSRRRGNTTENHSNNCTSSSVSLPIKSSSSSMKLMSTKTLNSSKNDITSNAVVIKKRKHSIISKTNTLNEEEEEEEEDLDIYEPVNKKRKYNKSQANNAMMTYIKSLSLPINTGVNKSTRLLCNYALFSFEQYILIKNPKSKQTPQYAYTLSLDTLIKNSSLTPKAYQLCFAISSNIYDNVPNKSLIKILKHHNFLSPSLFKKYKGNNIHAPPLVNSSTLVIPQDALSLSCSEKSLEHFKVFPVHQKKLAFVKKTFEDYVINSENTTTSIPIRLFWQPIYELFPSFIHHDQASHFEYIIHAFDDNEDINI